MMSALIAGGVLYYMQIYGFYEEVRQDSVVLVSLNTQQPEAIPADAITAIDADSSPIR